MQDTADSSMLVSLKELADLENERLAEEEQQRRRAHQQREREKAEEQERRRAEERARRLAEEQRRERERTRRAEEQARARAIERAELERARLEARAEAERAMREAEQHHERELARLRAQRSGRRLRIALAVGVALVVGGGGALAYGVHTHLSAKRRAQDRRVEALSAEGQRMRSQGRDALLSIHDRLERAVEERGSVSAELAAARRDAASVRTELSEGPVEEDGLDRFESALEHLQRELIVEGRRRRLAELDALRETARDRLDGTRSVPDELGRMRERVEQAREAVDEGQPSVAALDDYEQALERLVGALPAERAPVIRSPAARMGGEEATEPPETDCPKGDPMCSDIQH